MHISMIIFSVNLFKIFECVCTWKYLGAILYIMILEMIMFGRQYSAVDWTRFPHAELDPFQLFPQASSWSNGKKLKFTCTALNILQVARHIWMWPWWSLSPQRTKKNITTQALELNHWPMSLSNVRNGLWVLYIYALE